MKKTIELKQRTYLEIFTILFIFVFLPSCAQREPAVGSPEIKEEKIMIKSSLPLITIAWEVDAKKYEINRTITQAGKVEEPFTVSEKTPDSIRLDLNGNPRFTESKDRVVKAKITEEKADKVISPAVVLGAELHGSTLSVSGIKSFFVSGREMRGILRVDFIEKSSGKILESISITMITLNTSLEISRGFPEQTRFKQLNAPQARFNLLQEIRVKNNGKIRMDLVSSLKTDGSLSRDFKEYGYRQLPCKCETWDRSWQEKYPTEFLLLPLNQQLLDDWTKFLPEENISVSLEPSEEMVLGLYGRGEKLESFLDNGVSNSSHVQREVVVGCETPDPNDRRGPKNTYKISRSTPVTGNVPFGVDVEGVYLGLDRGKIFFEIRNGILSVEDDPASGEASFAIGNFKLL